MRKVYALLVLMISFTSTGLFGQVNITGASAGDGSYTTLGAAFAAIASSTGGINIEITGNTTEAVSGATLAAGPWTSITIFPTGGPWTVSGAATAGSPLVTFNGADNVTVNGAGNLIFSNTTVSNSSGTSTIRLLADATNNTFNSVTFLTASTMAAGTNGGAVWLSTGTTTGNDNNSFQSCKFSSSTSNSGVLFSATGSTTSANIQNSNVTVNNCDFYDYFLASGTQAAVYVSTGNTGFNITNNKIFQTAARTITTSSTVYGIFCVNAGTTGTGTNFSITGNSVGYSSNTASGTMTYAAGTTVGGFVGIHFGGTIAAVNTNNINNNIVSNIEWTSTGASTFTGISVTGNSTTVGNVLNVNNNQISNINQVSATGALNGISTTYTPAVSISSNTINNITKSGTGVLYGITYTGAATSNFTFNNNTITSLSTTSTSTTSALYGIYSGSSPAVETWTNNVIDGLTSNSTAAQTVVGIYNLTATTGNKTCQGNTVKNISLPSAGTGTLYGIRIAYLGATNLISNNTIFNLSGGSSLQGLSVGTSSGAASANTSVYKNKIYDLSTANASGATFGLQLGASLGTSSSTKVYNNLIGNLSATASSLATDAIRGISITSTAATSDVLLSFNTIYINATSTGADFSSSGVFHTHNAVATTAALTMRNNIIVNESTPKGSGKASAFRRTESTDLNNYSTASNNNLFYVGAATGDKVLYYDGTNADASLVAFKVRVAPRESNSIREEPPFLSTTGSSSSFLHIDPTVPTQIESGGIAVSGITDDYDGDLRNSPPDIGADEFTGTPAVQMAYTSSNTVQQTGVAYLSPNQAILRIEIVATGASNPLVVTDFTVNANGTTNIADLTNAKIYFTGGSSDFNTSTLFGSASPSISNYTITGSQSLGEGANYFWLAYDLAPGATPGNVVDAELVDITITGVVRTPTTSAPAGNKTIVGPMVGNYNVGAGQTFPNFPTLTQAITDLNARGVSGAVTFTLTNGAGTPYSIANGEDFPLVINEIVGAGAANTITFRPGAGMNPVITGATTGALIRLNGADFIIIDGSNSGGTDRSLTITNSGTNAPTAISLISLGTGLGATDNTIKNCNISTGVQTTIGYGISVGGATPGTGGADNDNNTIQNNSFTNCAVGIYAIGTAAVSAGGDDNLNISGNSIEYNGTLANVIAIRIGQTLNSNVSGNIVNVETTASVGIAGISIETGANNSLISRNLISKVKSTNSSASSIARGIVVGTAQTGSAITISNNVIYNVLSNWPSSTVGYGHAGIFLGAIGPSATVTTVTGGVNLYFNSVYLSGNYDRAIAAVTYGLFVGSGASGLDIRNNIFQNSTVNVNAAPSTTKAYAIYSVAANTAFTTINYNDYYASGSQAVLGFLGSDRATITDWRTATGQDANSISADPMFNSTSDLRPGLSSPVLGAGDNSTGIVVDYLGVTRNDPPTIGAYEQAVDVAPPAITYTAIANSCNAGNQTIVATITDGTGVELNPTLLPRLYYKKNSGSYASVQGSLTSGTKNNGQWTFILPAASLSLTGGDVVSYFILAQDELGYVGSNPEGVVASDVNTVTTPPTPNSYTIIRTLSGSYTVGSGQPAPFNTLTSAIATYSTACLGGPVTFVLADATYTTPAETFPIVINAHAQASATNTLTISPAAGTAVGIIGASGTLAGLIKLNGADWVRIDGLKTGGASLNIENTQTTGGTAAIWISSISAGNGATNNIIRNTNLKAGVIQNAPSTSLTTYGVVIAGATMSATHTSITAGNDNDNNVIEGNSISKVRYGIFVRGGSTTNANTGTIIQNNIVGPASFGTDVIGRAGILVREEDGIKITGNEVRYIGGDFINQPNGIDRVGIGMGTDASWTPTSVFVKNAVISGNKIHDIVDEQTFAAVGILVAGADGTNATNNLVANNMIYNVLANGTGAIDQTAGIGQSAGNGDMIVFNTIYLTGDIDPNAGVAPDTRNFGITIASTSVTNPVWRNNIVYMDLTSSSLPTLQNAALNIPAAFVWGTGGSNYNDLYAANAQANVGSIGGSGGTVYKSLSDWQAAAAQDANSISVLPVFVSSTDLHLHPASNTGLDNLGTTIAGTTTDFDGEARNGTTPDMGADEFSSSDTYYYVRIDATDLSNLSNWTTDINGVAVAPPASFTAADQLFHINRNPLVLNPWIISGGSDVLLQVTGLTFAPTSSITVGTGSNFNFGGSFNYSTVLRSTATGTARLGQVLGSITGATNVTIERYIPAAGNRAWRLLSAPVQTTGAPTIFNSWQDGGSNSAMWGTHVTQMGGAGTNGFDGSAVALNNSSIKYYNGTALITPAATNTVAVTDNGAAWFLFIRGNREQDIDNPSLSSNTTLRITGTPNMGPVTTGVPGTGGPGNEFSLIPNPYPSPVDFEAIWTGNGTIGGVYYIWDATLGTIGAYRTVERTAANTYQQTPAGGTVTADNTARYIRSGQAFFVPGNGKVVNWTEEMKTDQTPVINVYRTTNGTEEMLVNLNIVNGTTNLADGVRAKFDDAYSAAVNGQDIPKLANFTENLSITRSNKLLAVEKRPFILTTDTIFLKLTGTAVRNYQFEINPVNFATSNLEAYLEDAYLSASTPINMSGISTYDFGVTADALSANPDRFSIVFKPATILPVNYTTVKASQKNAGVEVQWTVGSEKNMVTYEVEKSTDGRLFVKAGSVAARLNNSSTVNYNWFDASPVQGTNYYRIKAIETNGSSKYSQVVNVRLGAGKSDFVIYPNPVKGNSISLQLNNQPRGNYVITLMNNLGQQLYQQKVEHPGGSSTQTINFGNVISKGVYQLQITNGEIKMTQQLISN